MTKKILAFLFLPLFMVSFLSAQSLAELSKKEKERRAAAKGKTTVVTNDDLAKVKRKPAMSTSQPAKTEEEAQTENPEAADETATPPEAENAQGQQLAPGAGQTPPEEAPPADQEPVLTDQEFNARKAELEDQWNRAQEMVDLLTMKMNGLWQEFYSLDDMTARDRIQQQISENYEKLLKAQQDETKAREELDAFIANTKREGVPQIWIR
jgi:hypothetical protein